MKLKEIIAALDKSKHNKDWVDFTEFAYRQFDLHLNYIDPDSIPERFTIYWFANWLCTDTTVGGRAYFLDDKLIGASWQPARKSDEEFHWVSREAFDSVHAYFQTLKSLEIMEPSLDLLELEEEFDVGFPLSYSDGMDADFVYYKDGQLYKEAQVVKSFSYMEKLSDQDLLDINVKTEERVFSPSYIRIKFSDSDTPFCTNMENVRVPYNIKSSANEQ